MSVNQIFSILWRRLWLVLVGLVATMVGAAAVVAFVPARYEAKATASVDFGRTDPVTGMETSSTAARGTMGNLISLLQSQRIAVEVVKRLNLANDPSYTQSYLASGASGQIGIAEWIGQQIEEGLRISVVDGTNAIQVNYRSSSPIQATLLANTFLAAFEDSVVDMKVAAAQQTASWLQPQLENLRNDLEAARSKLIQFQKDTKLLAPTAGGDSDINPLMSTGNDLAASKAQLLALQSQVAVIDSGQGTSQSNLLDSSVLSTLKSSLATVNADLGRARADLGSNNPKVQGLLASQKSIQDQINTELGNIRRTAAAKIKSLEEQIGSLQSNYTDQYGKMINVQAQRDELASMQREVAFRQEQVDNASRNAAAARMQGQLSFSNVTTLDNATPPTSPTFPKIPLIAALSVGAGLGLGVIFALIAEALDRRIRVVSDLQYATDLPLLGVISKSRLKYARKSKAKSFALSIPAAPR